MSPGPPGCLSLCFCTLWGFLQPGQAGQAARGEGGAGKCRSVSFTVCTVRTQAAACTYPSESPGTRLFILDTLHTEAKKCFCFYLDTGVWQKSNIHVCIHSHSPISKVCLTITNTRTISFALSSLKSTNRGYSDSAPFTIIFVH